jgi:hypothetical protein
MLGKIISAIISLFFAIGNAYFSVDYFKENKK